MSKLWLVARHEYRRHVFQKRFIVVLLSLPAMIALTIGLTAIMISMEENKDAVGYVDQAGLLADPVPAPRRGNSPDDPDIPDLLPLVPFQTEEAARAALESKHVQAYYVITKDYFETKRVELVYVEPPSHAATGQFWDFMQINRLDDLPPDVARRAVAGSNLIVRWPGGREFSARTFLNNFLPLLMGVMFIVLTFMSSGYLMGAVVEEKENRTVEMLMTTISPTQFMGGKVLGVISIGLTQLAAWIVLSGLAVLVGGHHLGIGWLGNLRLDWRVVLIMAAVTIPTYVMFAGLLTALGATLAEVQEAQQVSGLLLSFGMMPVWFLLPVIIENPDSPLTIGMTLFPTLALPTLSFRLGFSNVPSWQIFASIAISSACALGAVWLAGRAFRLGMLRYGQRLHWRELFGRANDKTLMKL
jgi:ABC-2 type transport system permease protein